MVKNKKKSIFHKIVIIGDPEVGKTSLVRRYSDHKFTESYKKTAGADFTVKYVENERYNMKSNLLIWDIAGDDKARWLRNGYYQGANGAIIVYDVTNKDSYQNVKIWYDDMTSKCGKIPTVMFANKMDLKNKLKVSKEEGYKLAEDLVITLFETSALSGENVELGFTHLCELLFIKETDN